MKQFVIAGTLAGALALGGPRSRTSRRLRPQPKPAPAGEQAKNQRRRRQEGPGGRQRPGTAIPRRRPSPTTRKHPAPPAGDGARQRAGSRRRSRPTARRLPAGTYQVRLTADEAKPDAKGSTREARALGRVRARAAGQRPRSRVDRPGGRSQAGPEGHAARRGRIEGPDAQGRRLRPRLDQQGRELLPGSPAGGSAGKNKAGGRRQEGLGLAFLLSPTVLTSSVRSPSRRTARDAGARRAGP